MKKEYIEILNKNLGFEVNPHMITESLYLKYKFDIELDPELDYTEDDDPLLDFRDPERFWDEKFPEEMKELFDEKVTSKEVIHCLDCICSKSEYNIISKIDPDIYLKLIHDVNDELIKDKKNLKWYLYASLDLINGGYLSLENINHFLEEWDYKFVVIGNKLITEAEPIWRNLESCAENFDFDRVPEELCLSLLDLEAEEILKGLDTPFEVYNGDLGDYYIIELDKYVFRDWYIE